MQGTSEKLFSEISAPMLWVTFVSDQRHASAKQLRYQLSKMAERGVCDALRAAVASEVRGGSLQKAMAKGLWLGAIGAAMICPSEQLV